MKCLRLFQAQKSSRTVASARRWLLYATHAHTVFRDFLAIRRRRRDSWTGQVFKKEVKIEEKNIITGYSSGLWKFTEKEGIFFPYGCQRSSRAHLFDKPKLVLMHMGNRGEELCLFVFPQPFRGQDVSLNFSPF